MSEEKSGKWQRYIWAGLLTATVACTWGGHYFLGRHSRFETYRMTKPVWDTDTHNIILESALVKMQENNEQDIYFPNTRLSQVYELLEAPNDWPRGDKVKKNELRNNRPVDYLPVATIEEYLEWCEENPHPERDQIVGSFYKAQQALLRINLTPRKLQSVLGE